MLHEAPLIYWDVGDDVEMFRKESQGRSCRLAEQGWRNVPWVGSWMYLFEVVQARRLNSY